MSEQTKNLIGKAELQRGLLASLEAIQKYPDPRDWLVSAGIDPDEFMAFAESITSDKPDHLDHLDYASFCSGFQIAYLVFFGGGEVN